jgi:5-methylcytosine-specific restriction endonuclease McrA
VADPVRRAQLGRADRLAAILDRDGARCVWCGRSFSALIRPTTDHLVPRVKGGPSWLENEVAACSRCNGARGHRTPVDWLAECQGRGWQPDRAAIRTALDRLAAAIETWGGQRRAARYLDGQRRRWTC